MKPYPRTSLASVLALLSLSFSLTARADKLDDWYKILPKNTVGVIAIKNTPELLADWEKSSFAKLSADPDFLKWTAPMRKEGDAPWDKFFKETTGEGLYDNLKRFPGASIAVFAGDKVEDFQDDAPPFGGLSETGDQQAMLEESLAKQAEISMKEDEDLKKRTEEIAGVTVHIVAASEEPEAKWELGYGFVDGILVEANTRSLMEYFITALKNGATEPSDVVAGHLARLTQLTEGSTDMTVYLNGETLVKWGIEAAKAAAAGAQNQAMPISPEQIIGALGLEEFQAIAMNFDLTDAQSRMEVALLHPEKPSGFIHLMRGTSTEVPQPSFVPADILSASVMRYSMVNLWDGLLSMINKMGPMAAMATMQLGTVEAQLGIKLREDLFGSLADEYLEITDGSVENQSQVVAFKVKDKPRLGGALDGVKRFIGAGFAAFEESEFLGHAISSVKMPNATADGKPNEIAFCLTDDYLFFSTGEQALLKKVLTRLKDPSGPSIWESDRVQSMFGLLPKGYVGLAVSDSGKTIKLVVDALTTLQGQGGKKKTKSKKSKGPKADTSEDGEEKAVDTSWFDAKATPPDAMWERYFGTGVGGYYNPADAVHYRFLTVPLQ